MKIIAGLIINKKILSQEAIETHAKDIETYISHVDKLVILNTTGHKLKEFFQAIIRHKNIEYSECEDFGQENNYSLIYDHALRLEADYAMVLEQGFYYEEGAFLEMKRYLIEAKEKPSVLTPMPLYTCLDKKASDLTVRPIKGCRLTGALLNLQYYKESEGFVREYYQTTFDYDYCITERLKNHQILLMPNLVLRNRNFTVIERRVFGIFKKSSFDWDLLDVYYETRNRLYLWKKFETLDPEYVRLDKKLFKKEKREMRLGDPNYQDKLVMMMQAKEDFAQGKMGKIQY